MIEKFNFFFKKISFVKTWLGKIKKSLSEKNRDYFKILLSLTLLLVVSFFLQKSLNKPKTLDSRATEGQVASFQYNDRFKEETVFALSGSDQIYGSFTTSHYEVIPGTALPSGVTFSDGKLTFTGKAGVVMANPLKDEPFYRIDFEIEDTGQTNLQANLSFMERLWTPVDKSGAYPVIRDKIASIGIDTTTHPVTYSYGDTELTNEYLRLNAGSDEDKRKAKFSSDNLSKFAKRETGTTTVSFYVTPLGSYAVVNKVNFSSLPNLYTGDYIFGKGVKINYLTFARWNTEGDPVTFKNLRITRLDNGVNTKELADAYFTKDFFESGKYEAYKQQILSNSVDPNAGASGWNSVNDNGQLLFIAGILRSYDYFFGTNHTDEIRSLYDQYLTVCEVYLNNQINEYLSSTNPNKWADYSWNFKNNHYHPLFTYGLSGYLTQEQLLRARTMYAKVVDLIMEHVISVDKNPFFIGNTNYIGDTKAEEFWHLNYLMGYFMLFPEDLVRRNVMKDYITFEGFVAISDGRSLKDVYGDSFHFETLPERYLTYKMKNIWDEGQLDQHGFHPNLNYAPVCTLPKNSYFGTGGLNLISFVNNPFTEKCYTKSILDQFDKETLRHKQPIQKIRPDQSLYFEEETYQYQNGVVKNFKGTTLPSLLEDWSNTFDSYSLFYSIVDESLANEIARNVYYLKYPNKGDLFCGTECSFSDFNSNSIHHLWTSLDDKEFNPTLNKPALSEIKPVSVSLSGPVQATTGTSVAFSLSVNDPLSKLKTLNLYYAKKTNVQNQGIGASWSILKSCTFSDVASGTCQSGFSFPEATDYFVHATVITSDSPSRNCSGNPSCDRYPCLGFYDCGSQDNLTVSVTAGLGITPTPTPAVNLVVSNISKTNYPLSLSRVGNTYYIDRTNTFKTLPESLKNMSLIKTANGDKSSTSPSFLSFSINKTAEVYIAYDQRAKAIPDWLKSFVKTGEKVEVNGDSMGFFYLYKKTYPAGTIILGGNMAKGASGAKSNYVVLVKDLNGVSSPTPGPTVTPSPPNEALKISSISKTNYPLSLSRVGNTYYIDRTNTFKTLPESLKNISLIKTANGDKSSTSPSFLSFSINKTAEVYIAYDQRAKAIPDWLKSFVKTGEKVEVKGDSMGFFYLYKKTYPAGTVTLGGNLAQGASGAKSNYIVIIK